MARPRGTDATATKATARRRLAVARGRSASAGTAEMISYDGSWMRFTL